MPAVAPVRRQFVFGVSTKFAPAERATEPELRAAVQVALESPIVTAILNSFDGFVVVLNRERQVVAANYALLERLGVERPDECLGFRVGELFDCVHAFEEDGGCGAAPACAHCAAASLMACHSKGEPAERECLLTVRKDTTTEALELKLRATPVTVEGRQFTVACLRDIGDGKRRRVLEQVFFHDIINTVHAMQEGNRVLKTLDNLSDHAAKIVERTSALAERLIREVLDQRALLEGENGTLKPAHAVVSSAHVVDGIRKIFVDHPVAAGKTLDISGVTDVTSVTDSSLLGRVLANMVKNAFEATPVGGTVRVWCEATVEACGFFVWNEGFIPPPIAMRIFNRSFSTKSRSGRGLGTYAMKLFGERYLGGRVSFTSTAQEGTTFSFWLPLGLPWPTR